MIAPTRVRVARSPRWLFVCLVGAVVLGLSGPPAGIATPPIVRIATVIDGERESDSDILQLFQREILALTEGEFDVRFPADLALAGDWNASSIRAALDRVLAEPQVDLVLAMGAIASHLVSTHPGLPKPVIAPFVLDAALQELPQHEGGSGVRNLSYLMVPDHVARDLRAFGEVVPIHHLVALVNQAYIDAMPEANGNLKRQAEALGLTLDVIQVRESASEVIDALDALTATVDGVTVDRVTVDGVYITPILSLRAGEFDRLVAGLNQRRLPTFSYLGKIEVERGVLAGLTPASFFTRVARRVALHVQSVLLGEDPAGLPIAFADRQQLSINMATARAIDAWPAWGVLTEAELIGQERRVVSRQLDLRTAVREAVAVNLELLASVRAVQAGAEEVRLARANLLPRAEVSVQGALIDEDRAASGFAPAEWSTYGVGNLSQLIYSDQAWANLSIQQHLQTSRELEQEAFRLDVALETASAYLNVLRGKTFERIQKENLELSRKNLELAQVRHTIGYAGPGEVYRWESTIASNRSDVIRANSQRNLAEMELNRLLHRPLEESFATADVDLDDPTLLTGTGRFTRYLANPWSFRVFREVLVEQGLAAAPELRQLDAVIAAQERARSTAGRAFWLPTVGLEGEVSRRLSESGAGAGDGNVIPGIEDPDATDWSIGVAATLPLTEGGGRRATLAQAGEELERLRLQRQATADRIEQAIRSALHTAGASHASIQQRRAAAGAARKTLDLVSDSYSEGVVSILELIDAQTATLISEQAAATAVYDFFIDLMQVERSINRFDFFYSVADQEAWFEQLDVAFEEAQQR